MTQPIITLTTDFGTQDEYVAAIKGVLLSRLPTAQIVDISHQVAPGNLQQANYLLTGAACYYPAHTVHTVVVDPGVGSDRQILAVEHSQGRFLGPDNGALTRYLDDGNVIAVNRPDLYLDHAGETFHGRDRFAPLAAAIAQGCGVASLGVPARQPMTLDLAPLERSDSWIEGTVMHIDRFGNAVTNIPDSWLTSLPSKICTWVDDRPICRRVDHYQELPNGRPGFLSGSRGTVELALNGASLAEEWQLSVGALVRVQAGAPPRNQEPARS